MTTPCCIPFAYREKLKQEIHLLVDREIITPVAEPTDWCAPIVVAPKKGTDRIRMCVDVRQEHYPSFCDASRTVLLKLIITKTETPFRNLQTNLVN